MAFITVSNIFVNATTASASEINTNFSDLINGTSDGTKDFSIAALTCSGTLTANGNVTLGNSASDDLTITASLASSIGLKTTYSYEIGSTTIGLKSVFMGSADSAAYASKIVAGTLTASNTLTLPTTTGTIALTHDASREIRNLSIACSVASSALTIAVKDKSGADASSSSPIYVGFRNATAATGTYNQRSITGALSMTVSSGSTLGHSNGNAHFIYVYLLDNSGTLELAVSQSLYSDLSIVSTSAEGGAGAADSNSTIYSTTARSNVPIRLVARLTSTQTTAGTWAVVPTEISLCNFALSSTASVGFAVQTDSGAAIGTGNTTIVFDDVLKNTHGAAYDSSTGVFTAPSAGYYQFNYRVSTPAVTLTTSERIIVVLTDGSNNELDFARQNGTGASTSYSVSGSCIRYLTAGAQVKVRARSSVATTLDTGATYASKFEGIKVGD